MHPRSRSPNSLSQTRSYTQYGYFRIRIWYGARLACGDYKLWLFCLASCSQLIGISFTAFFPMYVHLAFSFLICIDICHLFVTDLLRHSDLTPRSHCYLRRRFTGLSCSQEAKPGSRPPWLLAALMVPFVGLHAGR